MHWKVCSEVTVSRSENVNNGGHIFFSHIEKLGLIIMVAGGKCIDVAITKSWGPK